MSSDSTGDVLPLLFDVPTVLWADRSDIPDHPGLYVSPNSVTLPLVEKYVSHGDTTTQPPSPWTWFHTRFARQDSYWTSLCPTSLAYEGILAPLSDIRVVPVHQSNGTGWRLHDVEGWQGLERLLRKLLSAMSSAWPLDAWTPLLVRIDSLIPWPDAYQYDSVWSTRQQAKTVARNARAAFKLVLAKITYASYLLPEEWLEHLPRLNLLTVEETNAIRQSVICQATSATSGEHLQRAGIIVDVRVEYYGSFLEEIRKLAHRFRFPIWLYYGEEPRVSAHAWSRVYLPSREAITACRSHGHVTTSPFWEDELLGVEDTTHTWEWPESEHAPVDAAQQFSPWFSQPTTSLSTMPPATTSEYAPLRPVVKPSRNPQTRQYPGQTVDEFFRELQQESERRMAKMGDTEKAAVAARAAAHKDLGIPNRSHRCKVYVWELEEDGSYTRTLILGRARWRKAFEESAPSQRRYDPVHNEFDICEALDPSAEVEDIFEYAIWDADKGRFLTFYDSESRSERMADLESGTSIERRPDHTMTISPESATSAETTQDVPMVEGLGMPLEQPVSCITFPEAKENSHESGIQSSLPPIPNYNATGLVSYREVLMERLGLQTSITIQEDVAGSWLSTEEMGRILGHMHESLEPAMESLAREMVTGLSQAEISATNLREGLVDVDPRFREHHPYQLRRDLHVRTGTVNGIHQAEVWYLLDASKKQDADMSFILCLKDALTVNHILRACHSPSIYEITSRLIHWGIPFKTLRRSQDISLLPKPAPMPMFHDATPLALGTVPHNFVFGLKEYKEYEQMRDSVVNSYCGRAAVLQGGISWRLAHEADVDEGVVLRGPSGFHTREDHVSVGGRGYVDDTLSHHQQDVICGVYRVMPSEYCTILKVGSLTIYFLSLSQRLQRKGSVGLLGDRGGHQSRPGKRQECVWITGVPTMRGGLLRD